MGILNTHIGERFFIYNFNNPKDILVVIKVLEINYDARYLNFRLLLNIKNIEFIIMEREKIKFNFIFNNQDFSKDNFRKYLEEYIILDDEIGYAGYKTKEITVNTILSFIF